MSIKTQLSLRDTNRAVTTTDQALLSSKMARLSTALLCAVLVSVRGQTIIQPQMISDGTGDLEIRVPAGRNGETTRPPFVQLALQKNLLGLHVLIT
jgi:hypothetical protein